MKMKKQIGKLTCHLCNITFKRRPDFSVHIITAHQELDGRFKCPDCDAVFASWGTILNHHKVVHQGDKSFQCVFCDKLLTTRGHLERHLVLHTKERPFSCTICDKSYGFKSQLRSHTQNVHIRERLFKCSICAKQFFNRAHLLLHQKIHSEATKVHQCSLCGSRFRTKATLEGHFRRHDGLRPWKCEVCHMCFAVSGSLKRHKAIHDETRDKRFACKLCDKKYFDLVGLTRHISRTHEKDRTSTEKRFQCSLCPKAYDNVEAWKAHNKAHLPPSMKPVHSCIFCGQRRAIQDSLFDHLCSHIGEWLFTCKLCGRKYHSWQNLNKHQKTHVRLKKSCVFCGKLYAAISNSLYVHLRNHVGEKPYICGVCSKDFSSGSSKIRHMKSHRSE